MNKIINFDNLKLFFRLLCESYLEAITKEKRVEDADIFGIFKLVYVSSFFIVIFIEIFIFFPILLYIFPITFGLIVIDVIVKTLKKTIKSFNEQTK